MATAVGYITPQGKMVVVYINTDQRLVTERYEPGQVAKFK